MHAPDISSSVCSVQCSSSGAKGHEAAAVTARLLVMWLFSSSFLVVLTLCAVCACTCLFEWSSLWPPNSWLLSICLLTFSTNRTDRPSEHLAILLPSSKAFDVPSQQLRSNGPQPIRSLPNSETLDSLSDAMVLRDGRVIKWEEGIFHFGIGACWRVWAEWIYLVWRHRDWFVCVWKARELIEELIRGIAMVWFGLFHGLVQFIHCVGLNEDWDTQKGVVVASVVLQQYLKAGLNTVHVWNGCSWRVCRHQPSDSLGLW